MTADYVFRTLRQMILTLQRQVSSISGGGSGITQLTGDVTAGPGSGSQAAAIASDAVTNAKLANMVQARFKGRSVSAGTGDPEDLTANDASEILDIATDPFVRRSALTGGSPGEIVGVALSAENIFEFDDFINNGVGGTSNDYKFHYLTGTAPTPQNSEANHPGITRLITATTNTMSITIGNIMSFLPADMFVLTFVVRPNSHANADYYVGAWGSVSVTPNNAIFVRALKTDTNWFLATRNGGTETLVDTGVAITSTVWYKITIYRIDASTIGCTVNAGSEVSSTTNIPTANLGPVMFLANCSGSQTYDIDFWSFADVVTRF